MINMRINLIFFYFELRDKNKNIILFLHKLTMVSFFIILLFMYSLFNHKLSSQQTIRSD